MAEADTDPSRGIADSLTREPASVFGSRRHEMHVDHLKTKADDPQYQPGEGCLVWQLGAKGCVARARGDLLSEAAQGRGRAKTLLDRLRRAVFAFA
jgi:hypothetical protein